MKIEYPGLCFVKSIHPFVVNVDGVGITVPACLNSAFADPGSILILPVSSAQLIRNQSGSEKLKIAGQLNLADGFYMPELFDGSQDLHGKNVLIMTFNGWGDTILVQPAFRLLYEEITKTGERPKITLAGSWIKNFPYPDVPYIYEIRTNHVTLKELRRFDIIINLTHLNQKQTKNTSMKDLYLQEFGMAELKDKLSLPSISPDPKRVDRLRPVLDEIRSRTGKRLLYINWKSRFSHKNASPELAFEISQRLADQYHAVFFKDRFVADVMEQEVRAYKAQVQNLSHLITDFHDTVAAISLIDAIISVDTGIVHAAGALGIPGVALFGPFPPETHISDYPSIIGVRSDYQGAKCKGPCEETHRGCMEIGFAPDRISPCFQAIGADEIIEAFASTNK
ncbi:MAG TPA: glycosyltransferase family 9 protein [Anaerolineae bacterium]|nr:glycosyltransferase family 9 protein [Anaerolineae bacterium]